jgi:hypothetical protein
MVSPNRRSARQSAEPDRGGANKLMVWPPEMQVVSVYTLCVMCSVFATRE